LHQATLLLLSLPLHKMRNSLADSRNQATAQIAEQSSCRPPKPDDETNSSPYAVSTHSKTPMKPRRCKSSWLTTNIVLSATIENGRVSRSARTKDDSERVQRDWLAAVRHALGQAEIVQRPEAWNSGTKQASGRQPVSWRKSKLKKTP